MLCVSIKGKVHINIKTVSYDCESLIFSSNLYCTFLVLLAMYVWNFYDFSAESYKYSF